MIMILTISFESVKNKQYKIVALTLKQGKAYDDRKNPISHKERWGFVFVSIPIRNHSTGYRSYIDKLTSGIKDKMIPANGYSADKMYFKEFPLLLKILLPPWLFLFFFHLPQNSSVAL